MGKVTKEEFEKHIATGHNTHGIYLRHFIFGIEDGLIGGLGLITGISVATLNPAVVILSGVALMLTQAVSMGTGTYLSVKSQSDYYDTILEQEKREIKEVPHIEREEVRQIYKEHGFKGKELENIVKIVTSKEKPWLNVMMAEEFGLPKKGLEHPLKSTVVMTLSVMLGAFIPLIPHLFLPSFSAMGYSILATLIALFGFGTAKTLYTRGSWLKNGGEMLLVGGAAAIVGYLIGNFFSAFL